MNQFDHHSLIMVYVQRKEIKRMEKGLSSMVLKSQLAMVAFSNPFFDYRQRSCFVSMVSVAQSGNLCFCRWLMERI